MYAYIILPVGTIKVVALRRYKLCLGMLPLLKHSSNSSFGVAFNVAAKFSECLKCHEIFVLSR
jgi:hypothetical protein